MRTRTAAPCRGVGVRRIGSLARRVGGVSSLRLPGAQDPFVSAATRLRSVPGPRADPGGVVGTISSARRPRVRCPGLRQHLGLIGFRATPAGRRPALVRGRLEHLHVAALGSGFADRRQRRPHHPSNGRAAVPVLTRHRQGRRRQPATLCQSTTCTGPRASGSHWCRTATPSRISRDWVCSTQVGDHDIGADQLG